MFLALSEFDNFLFEFDKISLLAVAAGSRGVAPSVLNVDSEEEVAPFQESQSNKPKTDPKMWLSRDQRERKSIPCVSHHPSVVNQSMPLFQTRMGKTSIDPLMTIKFVILRTNVIL